MPAHQAARLIKAQAMRQAGGAVDFDRYDSDLQQARAQIDLMLKRAADEAGQIRQTAFVEGFDQGRQAGLIAGQSLLESRAAELAEQNVQSRLAAALPALEQAIEGLRREHELWLSEWEAAAVHLSAAIAGKILHRELAAEPQLSAGIVREALQLVAGAPVVNVRMHPQTIADLGVCSQTIIERLGTLAEVTLIPDAQMSPGGCLIETEHGVVDAQLETQLSRITTELLATN